MSSRALKYVTILIISVVLSSCSLFKSKDFEPMPERYPDKFYELDIKTKFLEKFNETGVKNGTIAYLNNKPWCKVVEFGEKYSVWIKDLVRDESHCPNITVEFNVELQEPALGIEGKVFKKKRFKISYEADSSLAKMTKGGEAKLVAEYFKKYAERAKKAGQITAYVNNMFLKHPKTPYFVACSLVLDWMNKNINDDKTWKYKELEAVICGAEICGVLGEWLWEIENGK